MVYLWELIIAFSLQSAQEPSAFVLSSCSIWTSLAFISFDQAVFDPSRLGSFEPTFLVRVRSFETKTDNSLSSLSLWALSHCIFSGNSSSHLLFTLFMNPYPLARSSVSISTNRIFSCTVQITLLL